MAWQDLAFAVGSMIGIFALLPTLRDQTALVPRRTSVVSVLLGGLYTVTFVSLGMWLSAVGSVATATVWFAIASWRSTES
ncbi:hypothetical protein [Halomarina rubra]|uniref:MtN3 and saliva related transmembrane protein n=1 Tax=Halomarina rubra TaxID=2071873 RepID=A0ABD6AY11_9EURY|nr:hypothetical protein [Halomarina rubra]